MKVTGRIHFVGAIKTPNDKFRSIEIVLLTEEKFPQYITIQFTQEKTELVNRKDIGEHVEISINLRGREWKSPTGEIKYFNTIEGWQINSVGNETFNAQKFADKEPTIIVDDANDDLPF